MRHTKLRILCMAALAACGDHTLAVDSGSPPDGSSDTFEDAQVEPSEFVPTSFTTVSDERWTTTAVRQVLHVFALGGYSSDSQIALWSDMAPEDAIVEMLTFAPFNPRLSSEEGVAGDGTMMGMSAYWSSDEEGNVVQADHRERFGVDSWAAADYVWLAAMSRTGANPFRQRIGLFETNYHMSVNRDSGVSNRQMFRYYDDIMNAHHAHLPYEQVMAIASKSAAIATQYNHRQNEFVDARFEGNEDFGREFHQLFFGILGVADPADHELVTIRNTSKMLTDMPVLRIDDGEGGTRADDHVTFGSDVHFPGPLLILGESIQTETADLGLDRAAEIAIAHPESRLNLPLIVVRFLADDVVDEAEAMAIQDAWASLSTRSLLDFLRAYAVSTIFHSSSRIKHWSSIERNIISSSMTTLMLEDVTFEIMVPRSHIESEGVRLFRPLRNVFGGQTGLDAISSGDVFRASYNRSIQGSWRYGRTVIEENDVEVWVRDWGSVAPHDGEHYLVKDVAEWLWQRYLADDLSHFGPLERAHVYALLGAGKDWGSFVNGDSPLETYTLEQITTRADLVELVHDMEVARIGLGETGADRRTANLRVGMAINFILATPYAFIQEGI